MRTRRHQYKINEKLINPPKALLKSPPQKATPKVQTVINQTNHDFENENDVNKKLQKLYEDIASVPNFSAKINDFLRTHDLHSKFRRVTKKRFPRRRVIARFPFEIFMADLIEYPQYKVINKGYVYILLLIDCFTKKIYLAPMKKKDKHHAALAFETIFKEFDEFPVNLVTDGGKEFFNSLVAKVFQNYGINHYKTPSKTKWKASMAERAIQTIKNRLQKLFVKRQNNIWIDVIEQIGKNYNATPHSSHKLAPQDVGPENRDEVYKRLYPERDVTIVCKLNVGDKVRKIKEKTEFEKGYTQKWSDEIYTIKSVRQSNGVCWYKLENLRKELQDGIWYYYQLNLVARNADQSGSDNN